MKQEGAPAISVLMPVYNGERYVSLAVESILGQSFPDFEFIIINDGSDDGSLSILQRYADADPRIVLISRENRGLVQTLNEGIELAQGSLIARMDADDIALRNRFQIQKSYMDSNPDVICVGGVCRVIDAKGRFLINTDTKTGYETVEKLALQGVSPIAHPSAMIRLDALKNVGGYAQEDWPAEDLALWIKLSAEGKIDNVPEVILEYRIHDKSISTKQHSLQMGGDLCKGLCRERSRLPVTNQTGSTC
jgi:glycosyltransferase involved in cell wall biosynthesis